MSVYFTPTPARCDFCQQRLSEEPDTMGYDFLTVQAVWGFGCQPCWKQYRKHEGLGLGQGQSYARKEDGRFWMVEGFPAQPEPEKR